MSEEKPIKIKKANRGKFTEYCRNKGHEGVTNACITEGLASRSAKTRKRANFARNSKQWRKD